MWTAVVMVSVVIVIGILVVLAEKGNRRAKEARFVGREELSEKEFYDRFYRESGTREDAVRYVLTLIRVTVGIAPGKVRPADSFDKELREIGAPLDGSLFDFFSEIDLLREYFKKPPAKTELRTVDDCIRCVADLAEDKPLPVA